MSIVHKLESVEAFKLAHTMPPYSHLCQPVSVPRAPANPTQIAVDKSTSTPQGRKQVVVMLVTYLVRVLVS